MKNDILLEKFLTHIDLEMGYSFNTIKTYRIIMNNFIMFLKKNKIKINKVKKQYIEKYILYLRNESKNSAKSIRLKIATIKTFLKYLTKRLKVYKLSPISDDDFKYKVEKKEVKSISQKQVETLLNTLEDEKKKVLQVLQSESGKKILLEKNMFGINRDIVLIKLLLSTGLRVSEALNIRLKDIDFVDKSIIINGKGNKYRTIFYDIENIEKEFLEYINKVKTLNINHEFIFVNIKDYSRLTSRAIQLLLKKYSNIAGLSCKVTPHTLRHTFATISIEKGANIKAVSQILGHSNVKITIDTYTHLSNEHVREVMKVCNPLSDKVIPLEERIENRKKSLIYFTEKKVA